MMRRHSYLPDQHVAAVELVLQQGKTLQEAQEKQL